jgi:uncharacterized membrane protein YsdA (DUF1294 family)
VISLFADLVRNFLFLINVGSLALMGFDKLSATAGSERVPEMWFFLISLVGGFVGVVVGMFAFRHKTRKISFQIKVAAAAVLSVLILVFLVVGK